MKYFNALIFVTTLGFLTSCTEVKIKSKAAEIISIENVLEQYVLANENQDFDLFQKIWAPDADIILFGTDSDERLMGWVNIKNAVKEQYQTIEETYISVSDQFIKLSDDGSTAWFAEIINYNFVYQGEAKSYEGLRFTGVLKKMEGEWKFVQAHLSLPAHDIIEK